MYYGSAVNCNFVNNTARYDGGAMYYGSATNSNFTENNASRNGGAIYNTLVANCLFESNNATNGGAMYGRKAISCIFNDNNASEKGGAVYGAKVSSNSQFSNNLASNGNGTDEVTWFDRGNAKTFTELYALISASEDADIYLNDDYVYDPDFDASYKNGTVITRAVTIHGNGHRIDGDKKARIFYITCNDVLIEDLVFENANSTNGSAIWGSCSIVDCSFIKNNASNYGGAVYGNCAFVNCTFENNTDVTAEVPFMVILPL